MFKPKVLLVVRWPVGGIRTFLRYVYKTWDAEDWELSLIAPRTKELRVLLEEDLDHLKINYLPQKANPSFISFSRDIGLELRGKSYDLVHSHGFTSGLATAPFARIIGTTHLLTSHDVFRENQFTGMAGLAKKYVIGRLLQTIDEIHSVSIDAQNNLLSFFPRINAEKCYAIPNGIESERFRNSTPANFKNLISTEDNVFFIGFFGRFMEQKGFKYLIDAMDILSRDRGLPARPCVLTFGEGGYFRQEKTEINRRGLSSYFFHLPFASNIASAIKGVHLVAMPSLWEACGLLAMEALVCGTPIVAARCVGLREFVKDTPALIVTPGDSKDLAAKIKTCMVECDREAFNRFSQDAQIRFDVHKQSSRILERYTELLG